MLVNDRIVLVVRERLKKRERRERKNMSDALRLFVLCKIQYRQHGVPAFAIANGITINNNITVWVK